MHTGFKGANDPFGFPAFKRVTARAGRFRPQVEPCLGILFQNVNTQDLGMLTIFLPPSGETSLCDHTDARSTICTAFHSRLGVAEQFSRRGHPDDRPP